MIHSKYGLLGLGQGFRSLSLVLCSHEIRMTWGRPGKDHRQNTRDHLFQGLADGSLLAGITCWPLQNLKPRLLLFMQRPSVTLAEPSLTYSEK